MKALKLDKKWYCFLFIALLGYTVKSIFVGADVDEGYGIMVGYRLVQGDRLLLDMWEPHQTSGIFTALFIRLFTLFSGGSVHFLNLFLRICFFGVQYGIAVAVYRTVKNCFADMNRDFAMLLAMIYYITTPKCIYIPEYSNLHVWFFTLLTLCMMKYYCPHSSGHGKLGWLLGAGAFLSCDVLCYPSIVLVFPFCLVLIFRKHIQQRLKEIAAFVLPCIGGCGLFMGYLFRYMSLADLQLVLPHILGDGSHEVSYMEKLQSTAASLGTIGAMTIGCGLAALLLLLMGQKLLGKTIARESFGVYWFCGFFLVQTFMQLYYFLMGDTNSGYPQIAYVAVPLLGIVCCAKSRCKETTGTYLVLFSFLNYLALILFSNWGAIHLNVYLITGLLGGILCWKAYFGKVMGEKGIGLLQMLMVVFLISNVFGRCFLIIGGDATHTTIFDVRGINRQGLRAGILTSYMTAYRYNTNQEIWHEVAPEGSTVLYVGPSQFFCMLGDCRIASPNTISTPTYDEQLLAYWEVHPDRYPDVVIVESWFGDTPAYEEDSFIMQWLEHEYCASEVVDYSYVKVFRR